MNPLAQFPMQVTAEQVEESVMVADPLRILDCSPITDGAAAVDPLPARDGEAAQEGPDHPRRRLGHATDAIALHDREDLAWLASTERGRRARLQAGGRSARTSSRFCEVHDCFTIAEIMVIEALGLVDRGEGGAAAELGPDGARRQVPGQPLGRPQVEGPPGRRHRRRADPRGRRCSSAARPASARSRARSAALTQNMGGTGASSVVHIFEQV